MRRKWQKDLGRRHLIYRFHLDYYSSLTYHSPIFYDGECYMYMDLFYEFWTLSLLRK